MRMRMRFNKNDIFIKREIFVIVNLCDLIYVLLFHTTTRTTHNLAACGWGRTRNEAREMKINSQK